MFQNNIYRQNKHKILAKHPRRLKSLKQAQNNQREEYDDKNMKEAVNDTRDYQNKTLSIYLN